jgi:hypothetical protein
MIESANSVEILDHYTANETLAGHAESEFSVVYFDATSCPHLLWGGPDHADALSQAGVFIKQRGRRRAPECAAIPNNRHCRDPSRLTCQSEQNIQPLAVAP